MNKHLFLLLLTATTSNLFINASEAPSPSSEEEDESKEKSSILGDDESPVALGFWWTAPFSSQNSRVSYALTHPDEPSSRIYTHSIHGAHEMGRQVIYHAEKLAQQSAADPSSITQETPSLKKIAQIVNSGTTLNPKELIAVWRIVKGVKGHKIEHINDRVSAILNKAGQEAAQEFANGAESVDGLNEVQRTTARLSDKVSRERSNPSDVDNKRWNKPELFETLDKKESFTVPIGDSQYKLRFQITLESE